jgi:hypothetical protein
VTEIKALIPTRSGLSFRSTSRFTTAFFLHLSCLPSVL